MHKDVRDVGADRIHPQKCRRPVASDAVSVATATGVMILLIAVSLAIALLLCGDAGIKVALVIAGYFVLNVAYCLKLKYYAIVDVFVVAFGFVLRLLCGCGYSAVALDCADDVPSCAFPRLRQASR